MKSPPFYPYSTRCRDIREYLSCAKAKEFDANGNEINVDYRRMLKIVKDSGYRGYIGIEFEGHGVDPIEGINTTKRLIQTVMAELG